MSWPQLWSVFLRLTLVAWALAVFVPLQCGAQSPLPSPAGTPAGPVRIGLAGGDDLLVAIGKADLVFTGTITSIEDNQPGRGSTAQAGAFNVPNRATVEKSTVLRGESLGLRRRSRLPLVPAMPTIRP